MTFAEKSLSLNFISLKSIHCVLLLNCADPFSDDLCSLNFLTVIITMTQKKKAVHSFHRKVF